MPIAATDRSGLGTPGGAIAHAEIRNGKDAVEMPADENSEMGAKSPPSLGSSPFAICIYVEDVDAFASRAEAAGQKQFYELSGIPDPRIILSYALNINNPHRFPPSHFPWGAE